MWRFPEALRPTPFQPTLALGQLNPLERLFENVLGQKSRGHVRGETGSVYAHVDMGLDNSFLEELTLCTAGLRVI